MRWALVAGALAACTAEKPEYGDHAAGVALARVGIMQGVDNTLYRQGANVKRTVPVIARRDGLLRFYLNIGEQFEDRYLVGVLTLYDAEDEVVETLTETKFVTGRSRTDDLGSSLNFRLDGEQIRPGTELTFELHELDLDRPGGNPEDTSFDSTLQIRGGGLNAKVTDKLTVVILPIRYQADGSNRLPDTSNPAIREIREAIYALYPTSEVEVRVDEPVDWPEPVSALSGQEWTNLLATVSIRAANANEAPNTYYYGLFDPASSIRSYCRRGCTLGLSTLAVEVEDFPRASIGLGFRGAAPGTLVHEIGHAHGRPHAPCGGAAAVDRDYPYDNGEVGVWGYSLVSDELRAPERHDMMSYCDPIWISDYNFELLHDRIVEVKNVPRSQRYEVTRLFVDETGATTGVHSVKTRLPAAGAETVDVDLHDADGKLLRTVPGAFDPLSHFEGGAVTLDELLPEGVTARVRR